MDFGPFVAQDEKPEGRTISITFSANSDCVTSWVKFLQEIKKRAAGGHSFSIEADREDGGGKDYPRTGIDGDGADKILKITVDGQDVTEG